MPNPEKTKDHLPPGVYCKGSWLLGTACEQCDRCDEQRRELGIPDNWTRRWSIPIVPKEDRKPPHPLTADRKSKLFRYVTHDDVRRWEIMEIRYNNLLAVLKNEIDRAAEKWIGSGDE